MRWRVIKKETDVLEACEEMKTRIISGAAAIILLAAVVYVGRIAIGLAVFLLAAIGVYEFYRALEKGGFKPVYAAGFLSSLTLIYPAVSGAIPGFGQASGGKALIAALAVVFVLVVVLFCLLMFSDGKYKVQDISVTVFGIIYVVFLFSFVIFTRNFENGYLYIWLIFIGAWATDTFAYFTGVTMGRTKILPKVSPKKSLEGSIGGVIGCMAAMLAFGLYINETIDIPLYHFAILGGICGIISQIGDWSASAVKRAVVIKDYGNIMPGHGGVLDRLDSILFVAPAVYFYISLFF
jgi:phosphatidate cytidylyltransferase